MDTFRFLIAQPMADAGHRALLREVATAVARLAGLEAGERQRAVEELGAAVDERVRQAAGSGSVTIAFARDGAGAPVTIDVTSAGGDSDPSPLRLTWQAAGRG